MSAPRRWVADLGGTHARFARLREKGELGARVLVDLVAVPDLADAVCAVEEQLGGADEVALAVAGPVGEPIARLTNAPWAVDREALSRRFGWRRLVLLNDFEALAAGIAASEDPALETVRPGEFDPGRVRAVLGPGTGLGVAAILPPGGAVRALAGEGGHRDLAAGDEAEWELLRRVRARHGDAEAERVLSGPGLSTLYELLGDGERHGGEAARAEEVVERAREGEEAAVAAVRRFSALLGSFAGDTVLTYGARGGLYLGGGVVRGLGALFDRERFGRRFLDKGRMRAYLEPVPVAILTDPVDLALRGAALALSAGAD